MKLKNIHTKFTKTTLIESSSNKREINLEHLKY